ncbi:hypothetical protein [Arthrobacter sp. MYb211]|uniref:hypothetical protein n=2 Tax=unclassified Arthrobacter TaxID=235627 RepID=UPI0011B0B806|nr:hypothetical protein [Arthrobacter sp. MYb211]
MPHKITYKPLLGQGPNGQVYGAPVEIERAYVEDKVQVIKIADGADVASSSFIVVDPDVVIPPESLITVWTGTPRERESRLMQSNYFQHPSAPSHVVLYLE